MASVVRTKRGAWEIRESVRTPDGPRSRTLATFKALDEQVLAHARGRAMHTFEDYAVVAAAKRMGAPVEMGEADSAAAELLKALAHGKQLRPALKSLLSDALAATPDVSDAARAAGAWVGSTLEDRGAALVDLLLLADALPAPRKGKDSDGFPRLSAA